MMPSPRAWRVNAGQRAAPFGNRTGDAEVNETKIYVSSVYPGNTAEDIEKLITDPLEDKLKTVSNVVEIASNSQEDFSMVVVEFDENISVDQAKQKVKDEIDTETSSEDWPTFNGAKVEPNVFELNFSEEMPILNINISGDYPVDRLKGFGRGVAVTWGFKIRGEQAHQST